MTQVRLLSAYAGAGGTVGYPGDVIMVSDAEAAELIAGGYAEAYTHTDDPKDTLSDGDVFNIDRGAIMRIKAGGTLDVAGTIIVSAGGVVQLSSETQPMISGAVRAKRFTGPNRTPRPTPTVVFQFDDQWQTTIDYVLPLFATKGITGCLAVIAGGPYGAGQANKASWSSLVSAQADGWEILNHSWHHYTDSRDGFQIDDLFNPASAYYDLDAGIAEIATADAILRSHGLIAESFVNPAHATSEETQRYIRQYCRAARSGSVSPYYNERVLNTFELNSYNISDIVDGDDASAETVLDAAKALVTAIQALYTADSSDGRLLILYGHDATEAGMTDLEALIDHIQATDDVEILTLSQALDKHENQLEIGIPCDGAALAVGPGGELRTAGLDVVDELRVADASNPFTNYVTVSYVSGNLELQAYSSSHDVVIASSGSLRPKVNGTIGCGEHGYAWLDCYSYAYETRNQEGDRLTRKSYRLGGIQVTSSPKTIDANLPAGAKPIMMVAAVSTELQGCANWQIGFSGGSDVVWGTALANAAGTVIRVMYDPVNDGSTRAVFDAETDIVVTAAGVTAGAIRVAVFYEEPGAHA